MTSSLLQSELRNIPWHNKLNNYFKSVKELLCETLKQGNPPHRDTSVSDAEWGPGLLVKRCDSLVLHSLSSASTGSLVLTVYEQQELEASTQSEL